MRPPWNVASISLFINVNRGRSNKRYASIQKSRFTVFEFAVFDMIFLLVCMVLVPQENFEMESQNGEKGGGAGGNSRLLYH